MALRRLAAVAVWVISCGAFACPHAASMADTASAPWPRTAASRGRPAVLVTLLSTPPGATVWINGRRLLQKTPISDLAVDAGRARLEFHRWGYEPVVIEREWRPNATDRVRVTLTPPPARVTFLSTPPGATVSVGERILEGATPLYDVLVPPGRNTVEFRRDGYERLRIEREWRPSTGHHVSARLRPLLAHVTFVSMPPGATVSLNGRTIPGVTPIENAGVRPGRGTVEMRLDGYDPAVVERRWEAGEVDRLEAVLRTRSARVRFETATPWSRLEIDGAAAGKDADGWWEISPGDHRARAYAGEEIGVAAFRVNPGENIVAKLIWRRWKPDPGRYVLLPTSESVLGSGNYAKENPPRRVEVRGFWMARAEVTVAEYRACVDAGGCEAPETGPQCNWDRPDHEEHPINCVRAADAEAYAAWLSAREELPYALPSAAQWERAARGAGGRRYPWGDAEPGGRCNACDRACPFQHFRDETNDDGWADTAPVRALPECHGPEEIFDLVGNVAEWCRDDDQAGRYDVRGGSWGQIGAFLDPAFPSPRQPSLSDPTIGFRLIVLHVGDT